METKFVWRIEEPLKKKNNTYVAKVTCMCEKEKRLGRYLKEDNDNYCMSCHRIIPTENEEVKIFKTDSTVTINKDNEIEFDMSEYPTATEVVKDAIGKHNKETYCQCETPVEQAAMFEEESICIRCDKKIKSK